MKKLKFQGPSLNTGFPNLTIILNIYLMLPIMSCEKEQKIPKLLGIKNIFQLTLAETLNYLLFIENDITISLRSH